MTTGVGPDPTALAVADFNGDGKPDIAVASAGSNIVSVITIQTPPPGAGVGGIIGPTQVLNTISSATSLADADLNSDGKPDLATAGGRPIGSVFLNRNGLFPANATAVGNGLGHNLTAVAAGDLNGDGRTHLVVAFAGSPSVPASLNGNVGILINDGVWPQVGGGSCGGGGGGSDGPAVATSRNLTLPSSTSPGGLPILLLGLTSDPSDGTTPGLPTPGHRSHGSNARS